MKKYTIIILVVVVVILGSLFVVRLVSPEDNWICVDNSWVKHGNPSSPKPVNGCGDSVTVTTPTEKITYTNATGDLIKVELPLPGAVVPKNFSVTGTARGTWFFEASFPVQVLDKNGNLLVSGPAQAQSDWMTENFVPFKIDIKIPGNYTGPATLVLKKDNPSGLPAHDASISFPVTIEH
jgi:uncharacterized protein YxeA